MKQDSICGGARQEVRNQEIHDALHRVLAALPPPGTPHLAVPALAARHRAMVLIGLGGGLRHADIGALNVGDVTVQSQAGLALLVWPHGDAARENPRTILVAANPRDRALCPVAAFECWMRFRRTADDWCGPLGENAPVPLLDERRSALRLFCGVTSTGAMMDSAMSDKMVRRLLKQACDLAGLTETRFSRCSLRLHVRPAGGDADAGSRRETPWWRDAGGDGADQSALMMR